MIGILLYGYTVMSLTFVRKDGSRTVFCQYPSQIVNWQAQATLDKIPILGKGTKVSLRGYEADMMELSGIVLYRNGKDISSLINTLMGMKGFTYNVVLGERLLKDWVVESVNIRETNWLKGLPTMADVSIRMIKSFEPAKTKISVTAKLSNAEKESAKKQLAKLKVHQPSVTDDGTLLSKNVVIGRFVNGKVVLA